LFNGYDVTPLLVFSPTTAKIFEASIINQQAAANIQQRIRVSTRYRWQGCFFRQKQVWIFIFIFDLQLASHHLWPYPPKNQLATIPSR
jgi:hypothetical protein